MLKFSLKSDSAERKNTRKYSCHWDNQGMRWWDRYSDGQNMSAAFWTRSAHENDRRNMQNANMQIFTCKYAIMRNDCIWLKIWVEDIFCAIMQLHIENLGGKIKDQLKTESEPRQDQNIKWSYDYYNMDEVRQLSKLRKRLRRVGKNLQDIKKNDVEELSKITTRYNKWLN